MHPWSERCCKSNVGKVVDFNLVFYAHFDGRWLPGVLRRVAGWLWHGKTRSSAVADATPSQSLSLSWGLLGAPQTRPEPRSWGGGAGCSGFCRGRGEPGEGGILLLRAQDRLAAVALGVSVRGGVSVSVRRVSRGRGGSPGAGRAGALPRAPLCAGGRRQRACAARPRAGGGRRWREIGKCRRRCLAQPRPGSGSGPAMARRSRG